MILFQTFLNILISNWELVLLFFITSILYSSVGFGGGSSYIAILTLFSLPFQQLRATALLCNIMVVSGGSYIFIKNKHFNWKKIIPLVLMSVPMAFIGGYLKINQTIFYFLLGFVLLIAALLMWSSKYISAKANHSKFKSTVKKDAFFGGFIGFISGMVGIGGGIFLAPLLHLTKWDTPKRIAATSSFFILVNSIAGLFGQFFNPLFSIEAHLTIILMLTVFFGGQIGSRLSAKIIAPLILKKGTALLIIFVSLRILWNSLV